MLAIDKLYWGIDKNYRQTIYTKKGVNSCETRCLCICLFTVVGNHCPYVKAILPRLIADVRELQTLGINTVAIMSNDSTDYPEDSFENMQKIAQEMDFPFPYLWDERQTVAKAYGAVCTPDFFGFNNKGELQYRGRFDESRKETAPNSTRDLFHAMKLIAETGQGPKEQIVSIGCSIKWKSELTS